MERIDNRNDDPIPGKFLLQPAKHTANVIDTPLCDSASRDGLSGINLHTNGTEFYGNSSNLAFLGNLYARARSHAGCRVSNISGSGVDLNGEVQPASGPSQPETRSYQDGHKDSTKPSDRTQLSIVNLLYNPNYSNSLPQSPWKSERDKSVQMHPETPSSNIIIG